MQSNRRLAAAAVLIGGASMPGLAQDLREASKGVVACQSIEVDLEKLTCFETAAAELSRALSTPVETVGTATLPVTPARQAMVQSLDMPSEKFAQTPAPVQMAASATKDVTQASATAETPTGPPKRQLLPSWIPTVSLNIGRGDSAEEPDFFETELTRIQRNKIGRHFFTTSDGQVWRQIQIEAIRAPDSLPAKATIRQTLSGSIRLEIEDNGRSYPVNRVE